MKKILTLVLLTSFLLGITIPALAAKQGDDLKIINQLDGKSIDAKELAEVIAEAETSQAQEMQGRKGSFTFNYFSIGDEVSYFYEKSPNSRAEIVVFLTSTRKEELAAFDRINTSSVNVDLPDGIGGRVKLYQNGSILTTAVKTSTTSQVSPGSGMAYLYTGFTGKNSSGKTVSSDIGLQWSKVYEHWKPYFFYNDGSSDFGNYVAPYDEVQYKNGYIPGETINFTLYKNYNGKIRFKTEGYAQHEDKFGNGETTWLINVMQSNTTPNMGTIDFWKILATIAGSETGKVYGEFNNIKIDGSAATLGQPEEDHASITISQNNASISVDSDLY